MIPPWGIQKRTLGWRGYCDVCRWATSYKRSKSEIEDALDSHVFLHHNEEWKRVRGAKQLEDRLLGGEASA